MAGRHRKQAFTSWHTARSYKVHWKESCLRRAHVDRFESEPAEHHQAQRYGTASEKRFQHACVLYLPDSVDEQLSVVRSIKLWVVSQAWHPVECLFILIVAAPQDYGWVTVDAPSLIDHLLPDLRQAVCKQ